MIIFFAVKDEEALYSQQKQDQEQTVAQIMNSILPNSDLNWRKQEKNIRPFRYDLNQIPYDYTVEVTNKFKGLDLIDGLPDQDHPQEKRNSKRQNSCLRRPYK